MSYGNNSFDLIDARGIDSNEKSLQHALLLKHIFKIYDLFTLFIVIKYENRFEKMEEIFLKLSNILFKYEKKLVILISHWDQSPTPEKDEKEIRKMFDYFCINIIFYDKFNIDRYKDIMANKMYSFVKKMKSEKIILEDFEFFTKFKIY